MEAWCCPRALVVESEAHLPVDFARIVVVEASEGKAVVKQDPSVGDV